MDDKLAIITVNYQGYNLTEEFLSCFKDQTNTHFKIFISDLSKERDSLSQYPFSTVILGENKGYAHGNNIALKQAIKEGYTKFVIINNDTRVDRHFIEKASQSLKNNPHTLLGGKIYYDKGYEYHKDRYSPEELGKVLWYAGGNTDWKHAYSIHRGVDEVDIGQFNTKEQTDFITGCLMLYDKSVHDSIGYWDESYFMYYEDADFCERAKRKKIQLLYDPSVYIWHKISQSTGGSGSQFHQKYQEKNRLKFSLKYGPLRTSIHLIINFLKNNFKFKNTNRSINYFAVIVFIAFILLIGRNLWPFSQQMFDFHDMSQPARIAEFTFNLTNIKIPPRIAPHWSYNLSFPVFNFYAPFAYWVTSIINIFGFNVTDSLKLSFLLALAGSSLTMFLFLNLLFGTLPALIGGILYASSPYMATEIFVRGNIGEMWFMMLFPLSLYLLYRNSREKNRFLFFTTVIVLSFIFTVHNIFSFIILPILMVLVLFLPETRKNILIIIYSLLLASYFLIPVILEMHLTYAQKIAELTNYHDHFLCLPQTWYSPWGYGGSVKGCTADGMSFMVGKIQIILGLAGLLFLIINFIWRIKNFHHKNIILFITFLSLISTFLTIYESQFVWNLLSQFLKLFQFPWRLLIFTVFGLSFLGSYFWSQFRFINNKVTSFVLISLIFLNTFKFFTKPQIPLGEYNSRFLSNNFINNEVAYLIPEYLPTTVDYDYWKNLDKTKQKINTSPIIKTLDNKLALTSKISEYRYDIVTQSGNFLFNIHYFPYWKIYINGKLFVPTNFDALGRPVISQEVGQKNITLYFTQTSIEKMADFISLFGLFMVIVFLYHPATKGLLKKYNVIE